MNDTDVPAWIRATLERLGMEALDDLITYDFSSKMTRRIGVAIATLQGKQLIGLHIRLSTPLWLRANEDERRECIAHEVCHLVRFYHGDLRKTHGSQWRDLMRECGYSGNPYHTVNISGHDKYKCNCGCPTGVYVSRKIFQQLFLGRYYVCTKCRHYVSIPNVLAPKTEKAELAAV